MGRGTSLVFADSLMVSADSAATGRVRDRRDRLRVLADSVRLLRALLEERRDTAGEGS